MKFIKIILMKFEQYPYKICIRHINFFYYLFKRIGFFKYYNLKLLHFYLFIFLLLQLYLFFLNKNQGLFFVGKLVLATPLCMVLF